MQETEQHTTLLGELIASHDLGAFQERAYKAVFAAFDLCDLNVKGIGQLGGMYRVVSRYLDDVNFSEHPRKDEIMESVLTEAKMTEMFPFVESFGLDDLSQAVVDYVVANSVDSIDAVADLHAIRRILQPHFSWSQDKYGPSVSPVEDAIEIHSHGLRSINDKTTNLSDAIDRLIDASDTPQDPRDSIWTAIDLVLHTGRRDLASRVNKFMVERHRGKNDLYGSEGYPVFIDWHGRIMGSPHERPDVTLNGYAPALTFRQGARRMAIVSALAELHDLGFSTDDKRYLPNVPGITGLSVSKGMFRKSSTVDISMPPSTTKAFPQLVRSM